MAPTLHFGSLVIDQLGRLVTMDGHPVHLTTSEYGLLVALAGNHDRAMSSRDLLHAIWGTDWLADTTALQVHASRLRHKLGESGTQPRYIQTVHGFGYRFESGRVGGAERAWDHADDAAQRTRTPQAHLVVAADRVLQWISPGMRDLLGWAPEQLLGRSLYSLLHPDDLPFAQAARVDMDAGKSAMMAFHFATADGQYRRIAASVQPIHDPAGSVVAFVGDLRAIPD